MIITLQMEISKENFNNFETLLSELKEKLLGAGREIVREALENRDNEIFQRRDKKRFRGKGKRKTCVKTWFGAIEYERQVYADLADPEHKHYVYLLDEEVRPHEVGCVSREMCKIAAQAVVNSSYRAAAAEISEMTGLSISPQGVWNIIQQIGKSNREKIETYSEQTRKHQMIGAIESRIVYEENDGIWLKLQGQSRKDYGASREMKVGIAYDASNIVGTFQGCEAGTVDDITIRSMSYYSAYTGIASKGVSAVNNEIGNDGMRQECTLCHSHKAQAIQTLEIIDDAFHAMTIAIQHTLERMVKGA